MDSTEPDYQFDAYLRHPDITDVLCDVHVWMPQGNHTDMKINIFSSALAEIPQFEKLMGKTIRLESETYEANKTFEFMASGVRIKSIFSNSFSRKAGRANIQLLHIADVTIRHFYGSASDSRAVKNLCFPLSNLKYATQEEFVETHYRGSMTIEEVYSYVIPCSKMGGAFTIKKYRNWVKTTENNRSVYRFPVLVWESASTLNTTDIPAIEKLAEDVALLITFAARHRVMILGRSYDREGEQYQKIRNPLERNKSSTDEIPNYELVPLQSFEGFIGSALEQWDGFSDKKKQTIRQIIVALHPLTEPSTARDYLALFSAFEHFISSIHESPKLKCWTGIEKKLRKCIDEMSSVDENIRETLKEKLPELKRESMERRGNRLFASLGVPVGDLWPALEGNASLLKVRNKLAHGDSFGNDNYDILIAAKEHLSVLLERVVIRCLGGNIAETRVGIAQLENEYFFKRNGR